MYYIYAYHAQPDVRLHNLILFVLQCQYIHVDCESKKYNFK